MIKEPNFLEKKENRDNETTDQYDSISVDLIITSVKTDSHETITKYNQEIFEKEEKISKDTIQETTTQIPLFETMNMKYEEPKNGNGEVIIEFEGPTNFNNNTPKKTRKNSKESAYDNNDDGCTIF